MNLLDIPLDQEGIRFDEIERTKRQHNATLLYTIPNFHNPTGTLMTEGRPSKLLKVCQKVSLPIKLRNYLI
jgi:GntR family transcriptional regulator, regulator for abcA and norABC